MADNEEGLKPARGGGYNFSAEGACSAFRVLQKPEVKSPALGFRLVMVERE